MLFVTHMEPGVSVQVIRFQILRGLIVGRVTGYLLLLILLLLEVGLDGALKILLVVTQVLKQEHVQIQRLFAEEQDVLVLRIKPIQTLPVQLLLVLCLQIP
jgi:hypothetical protein